jgi:HEAT repeat protein
VRDERWLYIRNYRPHLPWAQPEGYSDQSPFRREVLRLGDVRAEAGLRSYVAPQRAIEELYDTKADPQQLHNLASNSAHHQRLLDLRERSRAWIVETRDLGFLPEADMLARAGQPPPYTMAREPGAYPIERILAAAELVGRADAIDEQRKLLADTDSGVRYWAAVGLAAGGDEAAVAEDELLAALRDASSAVRIQAAGALAALDEPTALDVLAKELSSDDWNASLQAARTLQLLGPAAKPALPAMRGRLAYARQSEGRHSHALFVRFALEAALEANP